MGVARVAIGRWEVGYLPAGERIRADEPVGKFDELEDRLLADHPRLRRILVRLMPTWPVSYLYLHWSDGTDLDALDGSVTAGHLNGELLSGAVVGEAGTFTCPECRTKLRVVALAVTETALLFAGDNLDRTRGHGYQSTCPACGERWTAGVLEFIDPGRRAGALPADGIEPQPEATEE